jgi:carboxyl-terminal processing protease
MDIDRPDTMQIRRWIRLCFGIAIPSLIAVCTVICSGDSRYVSARQLASATALIEAHISEQFEPEAMFDGTWRGMKKALDPHTTFIPASSYRYVDEEGRGSFEGIGVEITVRDGLVTIIAPIAGSHAEEVGLRSGDQVIAVDSEDVAGVPAESVTQLIRGPAGSSVLLRIRRPGLSAPFEVAVERRHVGLSSITYSGVFESVGYIRINRFSLTTADEINEALERLTSQGISSLVLDLRGNPGGFMSAAVYISELFLPEDKLILATKSRRGWEKYEIKTVADGPLTDMPLAVLVDGGSASASEIVAGTLQDYDRAVIVGDTSFGKGLVQSNILLDGGNAFRVTTSKYYLPSGRLVQRFADQDWAQHLDISRAEMIVPYRTAGGRSVHGGGGIAPDVIVKPDSINLLATALSYGNYFFKFSVDYRAVHRDSVPATVDDRMIADFRAYAEANGFKAPTLFSNMILELSDNLKQLELTGARPVFDQMLRKADSLQALEWSEARRFIWQSLMERFAVVRGGIAAAYAEVRVANDRQIKTAMDIVADSANYHLILTGSRN